LLSVEDLVAQIANGSGMQVVDAGRVPA